MKKFVFITLIVLQFSHFGKFSFAQNVPDLVLRYDDMKNKILNRTDANTLVLNNTEDVVVAVKCTGSKPTEIIYDLDIDIYKSAGAENFDQKLYSERISRANDTATVYSTYSKLTIDTGFFRNDTWYCKYVGEQERIALDLIPSTDRKMLQLHKHNTSVETESHKRKPCEVSIHFYEGKEKDFYHCRSNTEPDAVFTNSDTFDCPTAEACAVYYRSTQANTCVIVEREKNNSLGNWFPGSVREPGVFVCWSDTQRAAVQYFFSGVGRGRGMRRTHVSWTGVDPRSMLSLMLDKQEEYGDKVDYHLNEELSAYCGVPRFGFAYLPTLDFYRNGVRIKHVVGNEQFKPLEIWGITAEVNLTRTGEYQINCTAPIWNSTEFAVESLTIQVQAVTEKELEELGVLSITSALGNLSATSQYVGDTVDVRCQFPVYGVGPNPQLTITSNRSIESLTSFEHRNVSNAETKQLTQVLSKTVKYKFATHGKFEFECRINLLNDSEWMETFKTSKVITVLVPIKPGFQVTDETVLVRSEEKASIHCHADMGEPTAVATWKPVTGIPTIDITGQTLHITYAGENVRGTYVCTATNRFGSSQKRFHIQIVHGISAGIVLVITLSVALFLVMIGIIGYLTWRTVYYDERRLILLKEKLLNGFPSSEITDSARRFLTFPLHTKKYIKRISTESFSILGEGNFGIVFSSEIISPCGARSTAAVKGLRDRDKTFQGMENFVKEIKLMMYISENLGGHENVVGFIGTDISRFLQKEIYLIMEYCEHGSLSTYLKKCSSRITIPDLHKWCFEISEGMGFLSRNNILHIDLATRNVLLDSTNHAKISDFGLARLLSLSDYYRDRGHVQFPANWTALELLEQNGRITTMSDVWSFGVTAWEIFSLGETPNYGGVISTYELRRKLEAGHRLTKPDFADTATYNLIRRCWAEEPTERPSFTELGNFFLREWQNGPSQHYVQSTLDISIGTNAVSKPKQYASALQCNGFMYLACGEPDRVHRPEDHDNSGTVFTELNLISNSKVKYDKFKLLEQSDEDNNDSNL